MHTPQPTPSEKATRQLTALVIAGFAVGGPLAGMALVGFSGASYIHVLTDRAPLLLSAALIGAGGAAVGFALLPSFFFCGICGEQQTSGLC